MIDIEHYFNLKSNIFSLFSHVIFICFEIVYGKLILEENFVNP